MRRPKETFADIWERDGRWLLGPGILGDVIAFLRGKAPVIAQDPNDPTTLNAVIPLPFVREEVSGEHVNVYHAIPPELQPIFIERCELIMRDWYDPDVDRLFQTYLNRAQATAQTVAQINGELAHIEQKRVFHGEEMELWELAALRFGFSRWAVPAPAGIAG